MLTKFTLLASTFVLATFVTHASVSFAQQPASNQQYFILQTYHFTDGQDPANVDHYLETAFLPALKRMGIGPVGVFSLKDTNEGNDLFVLMPFDSLDKYNDLYENLATDTEFVAAAKGYWEADPKSPMFDRIETQMLLAFKSAPQINISNNQTQNPNRFFEMRRYQSNSEDLGVRKIEMFNKHEVELFSSLNFNVVFYAQNIAGNYNPALTYMTCWASEEDMTAGWKSFISSEGWANIKDLPRYKGTVSKNIKTFLVPKPYSEI